MHLFGAGNKAPNLNPVENLRAANKVFDVKADNCDVLLTWSRPTEHVANGKAVNMALTFKVFFRNTVSRIFKRLL